MKQAQKGSERKEIHVLLVWKANSEVVIYLGMIFQGVNIYKLKHVNF